MNRVVNSTVLSNFAAIGRLDLLCDTVSPLYLPTDVYDEAMAGQIEKAHYHSPTTDLRQILP